MIKFAYIIKNEDFENINIEEFKEVVIHRGDAVPTNTNVNYYEDNIVVDINSSNIVEKYMKYHDIIISLRPGEEDKILEIKKMFSNIPSEIEYSIVSRGTELCGSKGYMAISKVINGSKKLVVQNHFERFVTTYKDVLDCALYDIENIAFSRFELISALALSKIKFEDDITLCGLGNVGIGCLIFLLNSGYKSIKVYDKKQKKYIRSAVDKLKQKYSAHIQLVDCIQDSNTYIDTTGSSGVIENIFENIGLNKTIFLIGTPREKKYSIDPLLVHRNNLIVIGGHEIRGVSLEKRNSIFKNLLHKNKNDSFISEIVNVQDYYDGILNDKLRRKSNFIEVIHYDG